MKLLFLVCFTLQFSNGMSVDDYVKCDFTYYDGLNVKWNAENMEHFCYPLPEQCTVWPTKLPKKFKRYSTIHLGEDKEKFKDIAVGIVIEMATGQITWENGGEELEGKQNLLKCSARFHSDDALYLKDLHLICDKKYVLIKQLDDAAQAIRIDAYNKANSDSCKLFEEIKESIYSLIEDQALRDKAEKSCKRACSPLSVYAIVGIVVGCIAGVCLIGGIIFCVVKSK